MNETSFRTKVIIGVALAVLVIFICLSNSPSNFVLNIFQVLFFDVFVFCMPWGWSLPNKLIATWNTDIIIPIPIYLGIKIVCAFLLGWAGLLYDLYLMFIKK